MRKRPHTAQPCKVVRNDAVSDEVVISFSDEIVNWLSICF
jgi:hypothetical protein